MWFPFVDNKGVSMETVVLLDDAADGCDRVGAEISYQLADLTPGPGGIDIMAATNIQANMIDRTVVVPVKTQDITGLDVR